MVIDAMPVLVTPWGACVLAPARPACQLGATVAVAYAQLFVATDTGAAIPVGRPVVAIAATQRSIRDGGRYDGAGDAVQPVPRRRRLGVALKGGSVPRWATYPQCPHTGLGVLS